MAERKTTDRNLYYLHELDDYKVASGYPDVRGWEVKDSHDRTIGKVDNLLVNKEAKRVVYLDVEIDESLRKENKEPLNTPANAGVHQFVNKDGDNHLIVPIGLVDLDDDKNIVHSNEISQDTFRTHRRFAKGAMENPDNELIVYRLYVPDTDINDRSGMNDRMYDRREFQPRSRMSANR